MIRILLLATLMATTATLSQAEPFVARFDGAVRITHAPDSQCQGLFTPNNDRISYYVYQDGESVLAVLTRVRDDDQLEWIMSNSGQFNGQGSFCGHLSIFGIPFPLNGQFNLNQDPDAVTGTTPFVTLQGTLANYPVYGCQATIKATMTRNNTIVDGASAARTLRQLRSMSAKSSRGGSYCGGFY